MAQAVSADLKQSGIFQCSATDQGSATGKEIHVAGEFSAAQNLHNRLAVSRDLNCFNAATEDDKNPMLEISPLENNLMRLRSSLFAERLKLSNLIVIKDGKPGIDL
jgi:hypothetical protein